MEPRPPAKKRKSATDMEAETARFHSFIVEIHYGRIENAKKVIVDLGKPFNITTTWNILHELGHMLVDADRRGNAFQGMMIMFENGYLDMVLEHADKDNDFKMGYIFERYFIVQKLKRLQSLVSEGRFGKISAHVKEMVFTQRPLALRTVWRPPTQTVRQYREFQCQASNMLGRLPEMEEAGWGRHRVMMLLLANQLQRHGKVEGGVYLSSIPIDVIVERVLPFIGPKYCHPRNVQHILNMIPVIEEQRKKQAKKTEQIKIKS